MTNRELTKGKVNTDAIAPTEDGATASQAYAVGSHFLRGGKYCTAIAAISNGGTFTLNTNYKVTRVGDEIAGAVIFDHTQVFSIAPDGTKTNGQLILEGRSALMTYLSNNPQYRYSYDNAVMDLKRDLADRHEILSNYEDVRFFGMVFSGSDIIHSEIYLTPTPAYLVAINGTISDQTNTVATNTFYLIIEVYKIL
jgi:hypothetical protein